MRDFFYGCYFKMQSPRKTVAVIPAVHCTNDNKSCSIQLVTDDRAWNLTFPWECFSQCSRSQGVEIKIGPNLFCERFVRLHLRSRTSSLSADGFFRFGPLTPIRYDIMGPFCFVPGMECRHSVYSMTHRVDGHLTVNGEKFDFENGVGYMEGDRGSSFPREYVWTQCNFGENSLMLSAADIPVGPLRFTGTIGIVYWKGREYRFATYLGARVTRLGQGEIVVEQGKRRLTARLLEQPAHPLYAPQGGGMTRRIRESPKCRAYYRFEEENRTVFSFETTSAAFEYEYPV